MEKLSYGKSAVWIVVLILLVVNVIAQPGFLSIDCGADTNHTDGKKIAWVSDVSYIDVGERGYTGDTSQETDGSFMQNLRYFPMPLNKSCYQLYVTPNQPYLIRLWFAIGNYLGFDAFPINFAFSIETQGMLAFQNVSFRSANPPQSFENILVSSGRVLYICLIRTSESHDPFMSAIELRTLRDGMYPQAKPGTMLSLVSRHDAGGNSSVRYPQDNFDRIWTSSGMGLLLPISDKITITNFQAPISTNNTQGLPPIVVMQTAWTTTNEEFIEFYLESLNKPESLLFLYFAEVQPLNTSETRSFNVSINGRTETINLGQSYSAIERAFQLNDTQYLDLELVKAANSTLGPIVNAFENYLILDTHPATYSRDIKALDSIKRRFNLTNWTSDPCYLVPWEGVGCEKITFAPRIFEM